MHRSMMQIYVENSDQAVPFYLNAFGAKLICDHRNLDGTVAHAELDIFGQILAICESCEKETVTGNTMQFCLHFGTGKEDIVREIIGKLKEGAASAYHGSTDWSPLMAGIIDKFGVNWYIFV